MRQISLVAFLQAQNCTTIPAAWRHPDGWTNSYSPEYYQHIGRVLEEGKFDMGFFDDRLAMPDMYMGDHAHTVENGIRCVKMDPVTCMTVMALATKHLGLGATMSTTYYNPFHVARLFQTVDLMTRGRAAWNVVTSVNDNEAKNWGWDKAMEHDLRYDRADEFMEIVRGHWDSWDDDAVLYDKTNMRFADPDKIRRLDYEGQYYKSRGPFTVPRSPQGNPVLIQAGASGRGMKFGSRWGEVIFTAWHNLERAKEGYADMKSQCAALGRNPDHFKLCNIFYPMAAETRMEAEDKAAFYNTLPNEVDQLSLLSEALNYDFAAKGIDEPFSDGELEGITGMQAMRDRVTKVAGIKNPTPRDFMEVTGRGRMDDPWVGTGKEIADMMEEYFTEPACDGFVVAPTWLPGSFEDFVKFVVPEIQKRGLYRKEYPGTTLRETLGIPQPTLGEWKTKAAAE
jgi:FMN-dependent oxidoreductase (nitrilotriacetate monooxygenase family)